MAKIYWAASLHDKDEQERNRREVAKLRAAGHEVFLPQEQGVWEDEVNKLLHIEGLGYDDAQERVRKGFYAEDKEAVDWCDFVVAYADRRPSEGMIWEMGYCVGLRKEVILVDVIGWDFNLMLQYGSTVVKTTEEAIDTIQKRS